MTTPRFSSTSIVSVLLLIVAASLLSPIHTHAKPLTTDVGGVISTDTIWDQANSPYIVTSDVAVQSGVTLTVEAGVEIRFSAGTSLYVDGGFRVEGTPDANVVMTSNESSPAVGDWEGIRVRAQSGGQCVIDYARIQYANTGVFASDSSPTIDHSYLEYNNTGIGCDWSTASPHIENSTLSNNGAGISCISYGPTRVISNTLQNNGTGIVAECHGWEIKRNLVIQNNDGIRWDSGGGCDVGTVSNNVIAENSGTGMYVFGYAIGASTPISTNHLVANETGVYFKDCQGSLSNNTIADNRNGIVNNQGSYPAGLEISGNNLFRNEEYNLTHLRTDVLTATYNYWGATVSAVIEDGIYDYYDDFDIGVVDYTGYLSDTVSGAPVSPPTDVELTLQGADVRVQWARNPESDTVGYRVHYDSDSGYPYANAIDAGNVTSTTVTNVSPSVHFFAVTAYDSTADGTTDWTDGNESWFSNEVVLALVVTPPADQATTEGNPASIALGSFADPIAGTSWEVDVEWGDGAANTVFMLSATGSLGNQTHTYGADGTYIVTVTVGNGSDSHSATFQVDVSPQSSGNDAPAFSSSPDLAAIVGFPYTYEIVASDPDAGDVLTITAPVKPGWLHLAPTGNGTATLSGTPGPRDVGKHPVLLRVQDQVGASYSQYFTIIASRSNPPSVLNLPSVRR